MSNLAEAKEEDLTKYENLAAFFFRELKEYARKVEYGSLLTSPSDGYVLYRGLIENGKIEHIKGFTYDMNALIGVEEQNSNLFKKGRLLRNNTIEDVDVEIEKMKSSVNDEVPIIYNNEYKKKDNLFYCVIYLAPGDYHRFHSPCDWKIEKRRHFTGELYSVSPKIVNTITNLFVLNERVVLSGKWEHGLFSFIPVGATNVGSIIINFDEELKTNLPDRHILDPPGTYNEKLLSKDVQQGEELGGFKLGSTIVLLFEAPKNNFKFDIVPGEHVKMGQRIAHLEK
ncbi:phosphatidylserine decarboxylase 1 [Clydaea vesicula]|uniref:phosphatidylserine decarboxylase n=1 Tax=Clydaea vesicula TaxID=447962 RepID=A0AAD5U5H5_9FUNG|nr:phosphatidylserine decarboxylase 1 [Clydaea vesicula]